MCLPSSIYSPHGLVRRKITFLLMRVNLHHAVLTMWFIVNQVELESLKHTSTSCAFEAIDVPNQTKQHKKNGEKQGTGMMKVAWLIIQTRRRY